MKTKLLTILLTLLTGVLFSQTATINSKTDRANAAGTDAFLIQTAGNTTYKMRLDSIKKYSIAPWVADSAKYVFFQDTLTVIASQFDIATLPSKIPYSDTTSKVVTLTQLNDSLQSDFAHVYKTTDKSITISTGEEYKTIKDFSVDGQKSGVNLNDSSFAILQTGTYLINYSVSLSSGTPGIVQTNIFVNTTAKSEGSAIFDITAPANVVNLNSTAILSVSYGNVIKLMATYDSAATLTHSTVNITIIRLY